MQNNFNADLTYDKLAVFYSQSLKNAVPPKPLYLNNMVKCWCFVCSFHVYDTTWWSQVVLQCIQNMMHLSLGPQTL